MEFQKRLPYGKNKGKVCIRPGCTDAAKARRLCAHHYLKAYTTMRKRDLARATQKGAQK